jgi:hypothetical protein
MTEIPSTHDALPDDLRELLELAGKQHNGVPKGLAACPVCGDWIGRCLWPDPLLWSRGLTRVSCRCEANLCGQCGEPIYEYRLGANVYDEGSGRISDVPGMVGAFHHCGQPRIELPCPIQPFWDEKYSPLLAGFPVQLAYIGVRPRNDGSRKPIVVKARYAFDPGSFFENDLKKEMRYRSCLPSDFFVDVIRLKKSQDWQTFKYDKNRLLFHATGSQFEEAMKNTLAIGLYPDEPAK